MPSQAASRLSPRLLSIPLLIIFAARPSPAQSDARPTVLSAPAEREIRGGETHAYGLSLAAGQFVRVRVDQRGTNLNLTLLDPAGQPAEAASPNTDVGPEYLFGLAVAAGEYRLEVRTAKGKASPGRYEIRVEELREATPRDARSVGAARAVAEASRLRLTGTAESLGAAVAKYKEALALWKELDDRRQQAVALDGMGLAYLALKENQKALECHTQAHTLLREAGDTWGEAATLNNVGAVYNALNQHRKALDFYGQALPLARAAGDRWGEALTLTNIAWTHWALDENRKALEVYSQALPVYRETGDQWNVGSTLNNIGWEHSRLAEHREALEFYERALEHWRAIGDRRGEAQTLSNIGNIYWELAEADKALEYYGRAAPIQRAEGDRRREAHSLGNMSRVFAALGEHQKALDLINQSLPMLRETGDRRAEALGFDYIGDAHWMLGDDQTALVYYDRALAIKGEIADRRGEGATLDKIGSTHRAQGDPRRALEYYARALAIARDVVNRHGEALALSNMGLSYADLGERGRALEHFNAALEIQRAVGDRRGEAQTLDHIAAVHESAGERKSASDFYARALALHRAIFDRWGESRSLFGAARVGRDEGNFVAARSHIEAALGIVESLRSKIAGPDWRAVYVASNLDMYKFHVDLLMRLHERDPSGGHAEAALAASERARARSLLEDLSESGADIRQGVEPELLAGEARTRQQINLKAERLTRLLSSKHTAGQEAAARKEMDSLLVDYQNLRAQIRTRSPRFAALTQPESLTAREIQTRVLDPDTLLLEYSLGEARSYLWAVTPDAVNAYVLPGRAEIEDAARRVYELMTARNGSVGGETPELRLARVRQADAQLADASRQLSRMILAPAARHLKVRRLLVVADGALQYVPFAALPRPSAVGPSPPLITGHEVVSLPSASTLALLRREAKGGRVAASPRKTLAVLADPVFGVDDPRVGERRVAAQAPPAGQAREGDVVRSAREAGVERLERLRFSSHEAESIASLAPPSLSLKAVSFAANKATAMGGELGGFRIVHFATHGLINTRHPELSGIVLSLVDEWGQPRDGFLRLHEIYNLKLDADLVVLSACQTALGKEVRGEGLVGLARGFMYAGSPRVVASLWKVDDRATAELMTLFYRAMLGQKLPPAAALRRAQAEMSKKWPSPYYWAGFTLQGEWK
jgi:CHAT domain-containing protein